MSKAQARSDNYECFVTEADHILAIQQARAEVWREAAKVAKESPNNWKGVAAYSAEQMRLIIEYQCEENSRAAGKEGG